MTFLIGEAEKSATVGQFLCVRQEHNKTMNSLEKMLGILNLFEDPHLEWSIDDLISELGYPRSTLYRYVKTLVKAGLLLSHGDASVTLGPRVVELDYEIRNSDPLIRHGAGPMASLVTEIPGVALLCRIYRDRVLCIHQESSTDSFISGYVRGRAMPLVRGAASRIILAHLPTSKLKRLHKGNHEFVELGLGESFAEVQSQLRKIRRDGYCIASGEVMPGVCGIAAPIFEQSKIVGSISISIAEEDPPADRVRPVVDKIVALARILNDLGG